MVIRVLQRTGRRWLHAAFGRHTRLPPPDDAEGVPNALFISAAARDKQGAVRPLTRGGEAGRNRNVG